jgi:hypothetical protein
MHIDAKGAGKGLRILCLAVCPSVKPRKLQAPFPEKETREGAAAGVRHASRSDEYFKGKRIRDR